MDFFDTMLNASPTKRCSEIRKWSARVEKATNAEERQQAVAKLAIIRNAEYMRLALKGRG